MHRVGVTVAGNRVRQIDDLYRLAEALDVEAVVLSVCNSGLSSRESMAAAKADIIWGCRAQRRLLRALRGRILLQLGVFSPVFVLSAAGVRLARASLRHGGAGVEADGGTLVGSTREVSGGVPAGSIGPLRVRVAEGSELPRLWSNGGQVGG
jgi:hypothetical protein